MLKNAKSTEKVIVKEHYGNNPYGLSSQEIEDLAHRNVVLELELKRHLDNQKSSTTNGPYQSEYQTTTKRIIHNNDSVPIKQSYGQYA